MSGGEGGRDGHESDIEPAASPSLFFGVAVYVCVYVYMSEYETSQDEAGKREERR